MSTLPLVPIRRGQGVWLEDFEGQRYLDAVSSWWVNLFGHANPRINAAVARSWTTSSTSSSQASPTSR